MCHPAWGLAWLSFWCGFLFSTHIPLFFGQLSELGCVCWSSSLYSNPAWGFPLFLLYALILPPHFLEVSSLVWGVFARLIVFVPPNLEHSFSSSNPPPLLFIFYFFSVRLWGSNYESQTKLNFPDLCLFLLEEFGNFCVPYSITAHTRHFWATSVLRKRIRVTLASLLLSLLTQFRLEFYYDPLIIHKT